MITQSSKGEKQDKPKQNLTVREPLIMSSFLQIGNKEILEETHKLEAKQNPHKAWEIK